MIMFRSFDSHLHLIESQNGLNMPGIRTAAEAKAWLDEQGKSVQEFARENSVDAATTYQVLSGRKKGKRGESRKIAVLLGMDRGDDYIGAEPV